MVCHWCRGGGTAGALAPAPIPRRFTTDEVSLQICQLKVWWTRLNHHNLRDHPVGVKSHLRDIHLFSGAEGERA